MFRCFDSYETEDEENYEKYPKIHLIEKQDVKRTNK